MHNKHCDLSKDWSHSVTLEVLSERLFNPTYQRKYGSCSYSVFGQVFPLINQPREFDI
jgi:hypothetical protein